MHDYAMLLAVSLGFSSGLVGWLVLLAVCIPLVFRFTECLKVDWLRGCVQ